MAIISGDNIIDRPVLGDCVSDSDCGFGMECVFGICKIASSTCIEGATSTETSYPATGYIKFTTLMCVGGVMTSTGVDYFCDTEAGYGLDPAYSSVTCTINNKCTGCIVSCSCSSVGYSGSCSGTNYSTCYTSCSKACTQSGCPSGYSCTYNSSSTSGTQYYGGSCNAAASTCSIAKQTCNTLCSAVSNTTSTQSCTRSCSIANGTCSYSGATQTCNGKYTNSNCYSAGESCSGCSSWGTCDGGTISITCNAGYYLSNGSCVACPAGYSSTAGSTSCTPNCNLISISPFCGTGSYQYIYKKTDTTGWYSDSACTKSTTTLSETLSTCSGWTNWGVSPSAVDTYGDNNGSGLYFTADGKTTTAGTNWTTNAPATLYIVRARPCAAGTGCTCSLSISSAGAVDYTTGASTGYTLSSGSNTNAPSCTANCNTISIHKYCGSGIEQYIYKKTDTTGWYSDSACTKSTTKLGSALSTCSGWTNWGVSPTQADTTGDNNGSGLYFTADGNTTTAGTNWTTNAPATLYNVRAKPCAAGTGCTCSLNISSAGAVDYTTGASTGYSLSSGGNTYAPSCSANSYTCAETKYLSGTTCTTCEAGYYCSGGTWTYNGGVQGRGECPSDFPLTDPRGGATSNETSINGCWRDCNATDVPNSTSRTGWKEYGGNNTCAATACAAGYYLDNGTCKACDSGYTSGSGMTSGRAYCYKTCASKTGYTLTGGVDYYSATDTCTYSANCNKITIYPNCSAIPNEYRYIYKKTDATGWYSDSACTKTTTSVPDGLPTCTGWDTWGVKAATGDAASDASGAALLFTGDGKTTTVGTNWTTNTPTSLYRVDVKPCSAGTGCTCSRTISENGDVDYTTGAQTGYTLSSGDNTYAPACSANCNKITINPFCSSNPVYQYIYKKTDTTGWYSDSACTKSTTTLSETLSTCPGWTNWGVAPTQSDTTGDNSGSGLYFTSDGKTTTAGTNWTVNAPATLYNVRARPCSAGTGCTCSLSISSAGAVDYTTGAQTGYTLSSGDNTYAPACSANSYTCSAGKYLNGTTCSDCESGYWCPGATWTYNGSVQGRQSCSTSTETRYPNSSAGSDEITDCYSNTKPRDWTGTQTECSKPSGCATVKCNACSVDACDYVAYSNSSGTGDGTIKSGCSSNSESCQQEVASVTASANYYVSGTTCPACDSSYPYSDGGSIDSGACYTNITRGCTQNNGSIPSGCASVTEWNACSCTGGTYVKYANGATSGTTTNEECTKTPKTVTANANRYVSGTTCPACPTTYPSSDGGSIGDAYCYVSKTNTGSQLSCSQPENSESYTCGTCNPGTCNWREYKSATDTSCTPTNCNQPVKSYTCKIGTFDIRGYSDTPGCAECKNGPDNSHYTGTATSSNECPWECDDGYNLTSDNQCARYCMAGVTHIHLGTGLKIPLYSSKRTTPSINVRHNDTVCYADLIEGESTGLHVKYNGKTYHAAE